MCRNGTGGPLDCQRTARTTVRDTPPCASPASASTASIMPLDPPSRPPGTRSRGDRSPRRSSGSRPTRGSSGSARATRWTASRRTSTCSSAATRWRSPGTSGRSRRIDFHAGRYWPLEVALWDIVGQVAGLPVATLFGGASDGIPAYASCGMLLAPAARAESALRLRDEGFGALKIRVDPTPAGGGDGGGRGDARRGRRLDGDHGRPQPGLADGRRHVPLARSGRRSRDRRPPGRARRAVGRGAAGRDRPARPGGASGVGAGRPDRRRGDDPDVRGAGRRGRGRRVRRLPARRRPRRRDAPRAGRSPSWPWPATAGSRRTPGRTGSACWPTCTSRPGSAAGRSSSSRTTRPAGPRNGATSCSPSRSGPDPTASCACRPSRGSGSRSTRPRSGGTRRDRGRPAPVPAGKPTVDDWLARAAAIDPRTELFIDGRFVPAASGRTFDDIAGRDGSRIAQVAEGGAEDVERAVAAARRSFDDRRWSDQPPAARKRRPAPSRRARPRASRRARPARVARRRQADPRHAPRSTSRARRRPSSGTPRRSTRPTARSARPAPTRCRW